MSENSEKSGTDSVLLARVNVSISIGVTKNVYVFYKKVLFTHK